MPSHFTSNAQASPTGNSPVIAFIGPIPGNIPASLPKSGPETSPPPGGALRAEETPAAWTDEKPFGRPLA